MRPPLFLSLPALLGAGLLLRAEQPLGPTATLQGHAEGVNAVAFAPDGVTLASGSSDETVKLWDVTTGKERGTLRAGSRVLSLAFTPDGRTLAAGAADGTVRLWDWATGEASGVLKGHHRVVSSLAFSPDGRTLASGGGRDAVVKLWDVEPVRQRTLLTRDPRSAWGLAFTPDGATLATGGPGGAIELWDVPAGKKRAARGEHRGDVTGLALTADGRMLASASYDKTVKLWEVQTGRERATLRGSGYTVYAVAFAPGRWVVAAGGVDNLIRLFDVTTGEELHTLKGHASSVHSVAFTGDGRTLASGSADGTVKLWDVSAEGKRKPRQSPLPRETARGLWAALAADDAKESYQAMGALLASPEQSVTLLGEQLRPAPLNERLARWLSELDDEEFAVRAKATEHIRNLGREAEGALRKALRDNPSFEVRRRVRELLDRIAEEPFSPQQLREARAVEVLEYIATPEARKLLGKLTEGEPEARLTQEAKASLKRLERR
jgi:hypothetical protein